MDETSLAFSYIRFSSDKQHLGDSLRRQVTLAERYAGEHGLTLDTHSYRDLGISAFRGRNAIEGKLSTFLSAIDSGHIKPKVHLLIESLDRLSRNDVDEALELFLSIIRRGVTIVTLADNQSYNTASLKRDRGISLIISITVMMRANEESSMKSIRGKEAWHAKVARGGILTRIGPSWLELINGTWMIRDKEADIVRRLFELALRGHGSLTICRQLNESGTVTLGRSSHWTPSTVTRILANPAVMGTLRREKAGGLPIENYYPSIVSSETFFRARQAASLRARGNAREDKLTASNIFKGICRCAVCDSPVFSVAGHREKYFLQCYRAYSHGGCNEPFIRGIWIEHAFLDELLSDSARFDVKAGSLEAAHFEHARHLCAALCGGRASALDRAPIRKKLQEIVGRIIRSISLDATNGTATLQYINGRVMQLKFDRS